MLAWLIWLGVIVVILSSFVVAYCFTEKFISDGKNKTNAFWVYIGIGLAVWIVGLVLVFLGIKFGFGGCSKKTGFTCMSIPNTIYAQVKDEVARYNTEMKNFNKQYANPGNPFYGKAQGQQ